MYSNLAWGQEWEKRINNNLCNKGNNNQVMLPTATQNHRRAERTVVVVWCKMEWGFLAHNDSKQVASC